MSLLRLLLAAMLAFLRPQIEGTDPDPDPAPAAPAPDPDPEDDLAADPADPAPEPSDPPLADKDELEAERRARAAERERAERAERELAEHRSRAARPAADDETAKEDAKLNDPATTPLERWQIQANRELRAGRTAAQAALAQAQDVRDQTAFNQLAITEPALHKRYATRVEQELANARKQGYNPAREAIYNQLIAADMRAGKFKKKAAAPAADPKKTVDRGKMPGARSDVTGRGQLSNRDRLAKKLENVQI